MDFIAKNIEKIRKEISKAGREVKLIAVSKTHPAELVVAAAGCGIMDFGESKLQEAVPKMQEVNLKINGLTWHFIGHLQSNKASKAAGKFGWIHSVDSISLAEKISKAATEAGIRQDILIEIKTSEEDTKFGIMPENAVEIYSGIKALSGIRIRGIMAMAPYFDDEYKAEPYFRKAREVYDKLNSGGALLDILSMGMSNDFRAALAQGSNMVRIGTAIFGERNYDDKK